MSVAPAFPVNDREYYPLHEEDDVPETEFHDLQTDYLCDVLRARFPAWRIFRDVCIYWVPGNTHRYRAPDVFAVADPIPEPTLRVYHTWQDPPIRFVAEIGSRSTFREDEGPKQEIYEQEIQAAEYLYANPPEGDLRLWRRGADGAYEAAPPEANGRLRSHELDLEFGIENEFLRVYTQEGERLRSHVEAERDREAAEERAGEEQARRALEAERRQEAEARAAEEARRRQEAEARVAEEARRRQEAEDRAEELERQLAELRAKLGQE